MPRFGGGKRAYTKLGAIEETGDYQKVRKEAVSGKYDTLRSTDAGGGGGEGRRRGVFEFGCRLRETRQMGTGGGMALRREKNRTREIGGVVEVSAVVGLACLRARCALQRWLAAPSERAVGQSVLTARSE